MEGARSKKYQREGRARTTHRERDRYTHARAHTHTQTRTLGLAEVEAVRRAASGVDGSALNDVSAAVVGVIATRPRLPMVGLPPLRLYVGVLGAAAAFKGVEGGVGVGVAVAGVGAAGEGGMVTDADASDDRASMMARTLALDASVSAANAPRGRGARGVAGAGAEAGERLWEAVAGDDVGADAVGVVTTRGGIARAVDAAVAPANPGRGRGEQGLACAGARAGLAGAAGAGEAGEGDADDADDADAVGRVRTLASDALVGVA